MNLFAEAENKSLDVIGVIGRREASSRPLEARAIGMSDEEKRVQTGEGLRPLFEHRRASVPKTRAERTAPEYPPNAVTTKVLARFL
jgi:hypothetical protein